MGYRPSQEVLSTMAREGHVEVLAWLMEHHVTEFNNGKLLYMSAAQYGQFEVLKWLWARGYAADKESASWAAYHGRVDILGWILCNKVPYSEKRICKWAANCARMEVLEWARGLGMVWDADTFTHGVVYTLKHPQHPWTLLEWLYEKGAPMGPEAFAHAALGGNLDLLRWLHARGCPRSPDVYHPSVKPEIQAWARELG
jgi:hypothetical protein